MEISENQRTASEFKHAFREQLMIIKMSIALIDRGVEANKRVNFKEAIDRAVNKLDEMVGSVK